MLFQYRSLKSYKYQLTQDFSINLNRVLLDFPAHTDNISIDGFVELSKDNILTLKKGYAWNGANVVMDTKTIMSGALVHDALYQLIRDGKLPKTPYRKLSDLILYNICREDKMWWLRANYVYLGVRIGGGFFI